MDMPIYCTIILPPEAQRRARSRTFLKSTGKLNPKTGREIKIPISRTHKAPEQQTSEEKLLALLYQHRPAAPAPGPLLLGVRAYLPIPKSFSKKKKAQALANELRPTTKPDLDNLIKHLKDVCKGIFWEDDKQIVGYLPSTGKYYGEPARWEIVILPLAMATLEDLGHQEVNRHEKVDTRATPRQSTGARQEDKPIQGPSRQAGPATTGDHLQDAAQRHEEGEGKAENKISFSF
jgi:Holliday junction resolvase RusA-like endonuclease